MQINPLFLLLIVLVAFALGWAARSYMYRKYPEQTRKIDDAANAAGDKIDAAYDSAKTKLKG